MRILATYKMIAVSQGVGGGDGGDGADNLYEVIDLYYWGFYLFTGIAIGAVLLIYWLRRRKSNWVPFHDLAKQTSRCPNSP